MKNYNIKKTITFIIPLLSLSCTTKNPVVDNSVFTTPVKTNIFLEKPYINKSWTTTGGNKENMIGHVGGKKTYNKLSSNDIGYSSETKKNNILTCCK